ncbi:MAG: hypothetical protein R3B89_20160 [Polyangiaceae bacterium]
MTHTHTLHPRRALRSSTLGIVVLLQGVCLASPSAAAQNAAPGADSSPAVTHPASAPAPAPEVSALGTQAPHDERAPISTPHGSARPEPQASAGTDAAGVRDQGAQDAQSTPLDRRGFVPLLRIGYSVGGAGEIEDEYAGATAKTSYDQVGGSLLEIDLLGHVSYGLRLGGGLMVLPSSEVDIKGGSEFELGTEAAVAFIAEGVFDLSSQLALTVRGFVGASVLSVGGDYKDYRDGLCEDIDCGWDDQLSGATAGLGVGLLIPLKGVNLRADLMTQGYAVSGTFLRAGGEAWTATISGSRTLLMAGVEL